MIFSEFWEWLQAHPTSQYIGFTWWFPFLESIHVIAITLVVGSILIVDLRLLGISGLQYSASRITRELIPWTWGAFVVATLTGFGMFVTRATAYVENPAFQIKFLLLIVACLNMAVCPRGRCRFPHAVDWNCPRRSLDRAYYLDPAFTLFGHTPVGVQLNSSSPPTNARLNNRARFTRAFEFKLIAIGNVLVVFIHS